MMGLSARRPITEDVEREIEELRALERRVQSEDDRLGRLQRELALRYPGHLVIMGVMPPGTWGYLPPMWQSREYSIQPRFGFPPREKTERAIAVSVDVAERLCGG